MKLRTICLLLAVSVVGCNSNDAPPALSINVESLDDSSSRYPTTTGPNPQYSITNPEHVSDLAGMIDGAWHHDPTLCVAVAQLNVVRTTGETNSYWLDHIHDISHLVFSGNEGGYFEIENGPEFLAILESQGVITEKWFAPTNTWNETEQNRAPVTD